MKRAIITFAVGYKFEDIRHFIQSCQIHTPGTDLYIYVGANVKELEEHCRNFNNIHLIRYQEPLLAKVISKSLLKVGGAARVFAQALRYAHVNQVLPSRVLDAFALPLVQFMVKRFFIIQQLLRGLPHEQVMLTDIRDVLLVADPFQNLQEDQIQSGEEPVAIGDSEMNARWLMKTYSKELFEQVKALPVICAGVTIGSRRAIDQYVQEMVDETYKQLPNIIEMLGGDQAIHMKLFYLGLKGLQKNFEANGTGTIATLHYSTLTEFAFENGTMKNRVGKPLAVVHQYDRHAPLARYLKELLEIMSRSGLSLDAS